MPLPSYSSLISHLKRVHQLSSIAGLLQWDEQVNLPPDSADARAEQLAVLAEIEHQAAADPGVESILQELESLPGDLSADEAVVVRRARRDYNLLTRLPSSFVAQKAVLSSQAYHAWTEARANNDFSTFAPYLARQVEMTYQEAEYLGKGDNPYDYMIDRHDPGMDSATVTRLFDTLKAELVPLVRAILDSRVKARPGILKGFPVEAQSAFLKEVTAKLGFNYRRGRIDVSVHPFCSGSGADIRMTTRFQEDEPLDSLFSSIHETGHGLYEQGLPLEHLGTPLGQAAGMAIHESQSRTWENQVGRSREFWSYFEPRFREAFPEQLKDVGSEDLYLAINEVRLNPIRVDSDEVTYNLHIMLRFELERRLFNGDLSVKDLPEAWRALSKELIGLTPESDAQGVLQDVHWSGGAFGYFPSYCLGNMAAAQFWYQALADLPGLEGDFANGDFSRLLGWLRSHVHSQGRRFETSELVEHVTGEPLSPQPLLRYLRERYGALYGV